MEKVYCHVGRLHLLSVQHIPDLRTDGCDCCTKPLTSPATDSATQVTTAVHSYSHGQMLLDNQWHVLYVTHPPVAHSCSCICRMGVGQTKCIANRE